MEDFRGRGIRGALTHADAGDFARWGWWMVQAVQANRTNPDTFEATYALRDHGPWLWVTRCRPLTCGNSG